MNLSGIRGWGPVGVVLAMEIGQRRIVKWPFSRRCVPLGL